MEQVSNLKASLHPAHVAQPGASRVTLRSAESELERIGGFLYIIGGLVRLSGVQTPLIGVLDTKRLKWRWIVANTGFVRDPRTFFYGDSLYIGSFFDWDSKRTGKLSRFDLVLEEWSYCNETGNGPGHRLGSSGNYLEQNECFVTFGGNRANHFYNDVHILDVPVLRWTKAVAKGEPPDARFGASTCVHEEVVYCYGGLDADTRFIEDGLHLLKMDKRHRVTWSSVQATLPYRLPAMLSWRGHLLCFGKGPTPDWLQEYNPNTKSFRALETEIWRTGNTVPNQYGIAFVLHDRKSFGVFEGSSNLTRMFRVTFEE